MTGRQNPQRVRMLSVMTRQDMTQTTTALGSADWYAERVATMTDDEVIAASRRGLTRGYRAAIRRAVKARGLTTEVAR